MPKLTTRQIIILGVMLLAVLYGAYDIFFAGSKKPAATDTAKASLDVNAVITDITAVMTKETQSPVDVHLIKRAEANWPRDPFFERKGYRELTAADKPVQASGAAAAALPNTQFNYTGYLDVGHKKMAIVNGSEYATGDSLDIGGYLLNGIYQDRIVIYNKETRRTIEIPLQE